MQENSTVALNEAKNNTETITGQKEQTLEERLALATEKKPEPERVNVDTSFFGSDEPAAATQPGTDGPKEPPKDVAKASEITEKAKRASASVAVGMLDMTFQTILTPLHGWKFKRKFKADEVKKLDEYVADSTLEELQEDEDKKLKRKWDRLLKSYEKKKGAIPLDEKEKRDLESAFYQYFNFKEKTLPPEWFVYMAVINSVGKRTIDLIVD